jgi:cephalosporin hydroxylase
MGKRIDLLEGSSKSEAVPRRVRELAAGCKTVVDFNSNYTHKCVLSESCAYAEFVSVGRYYAVMSRIVEDVPISFISKRPWSVGNSPKTAGKAFLKEANRFDIDVVSAKILITVAPNEYPKRAR